MKKPIDTTIEYMVSVDKKDRVKQYIPRGQIHDKLITRVCVIFIENSKGEVLVHKRSKSKNFGPGLWENAAGGVVNLESYKASAHRELFEEIGVGPQDITLKRVAKILHLDENDHGSMLCWFFGKIDWPEAKFNINPLEVEFVRWVPKLELFNDRETNPDNYMPSTKYWRKLFS